jgi:hypothetical protein
MACISRQASVGAFVQLPGWNTGFWEWGEHARLAAALGFPAAGPLTMPAGPLR